MLDPINHISSRMRDEVSGEYDFTNLDDYQALQLCFKLWKYYKAMQDIAWDEHTSDWDWYIGIRTNDGVLHGDDQYVHPDNHVFAMCDDFHMQVSTFPHEANFPHGDLCVVLEMTYDADQCDRDELIPIKVSDIASITISER